MAGYTYTKMNADIDRQRGRARALGSRPILSIIALLGSLALVSCDTGLLDVDLPGDVEATTLSDPGLAPTLVRSAQNDFECALVDVIISHGLWSSVFNNASTNQSTGAARNRRIGAHDDGDNPCSTTQSRGNFFAPYGSLQVARGQAIRAFEIISGHENLNNKDALLAKAAAFEGYSIIYLSEGYCEVRLDAEGAIISPADALAVAEQRFETAIGLAGGDAQLQNLARVGRARALNYIGRRSEAKALAEAVPAGFVYNATYDGSTPRRHNKVFAENDANAHASVHPDYLDPTVETGYTGNPVDPICGDKATFPCSLKVDGIPDPRVPVYRHFERGANDGVTPMWTQLLYTSESSPIPMATWQEAQLIIAEAELDAGNVAGAVAAINRIRGFYELPDYGGGSLSEVQEQLIEERRRTLFVQGHRLGDMIRFGLPFEEGLDPKGQPFVPGVTCIPLRDADL